MTTNANTTWPTPSAVPALAAPSAAAISAAAANEARAMAMSVRVAMVRLPKSGCLG
ncbi:MAG: hypothetical protein U0R51_12820 [Solirubrobacterales bacterium]